MIFSTVENSQGAMAPLPPLRAPLVSAVMPYTVVESSLFLTPYIILFIYGYPLKLPPASEASYKDNK